MKILITADIHIHDFRRHNLFGDRLFRLNQFSKLSERIKEVAFEKNCEAVIIAGDLLHTASPYPYITNRAFEFLSNLNPLKVFVTHGQHDFDSRTKMSPENTLLSLSSYIDNVTYLHKESIILGDRKFYFQGWTEDQNFDHVLVDEYDVLVGHATISNSLIDQYGYCIGNAQDIPYQKFKICFMGDVHRHQVINNIVIPGPPIQNRVSDHPNTGFIIFDTKEFIWYRIPVITNDYKFLRFIIDDKETEDPYTVIHRPKSSRKESRKEEINKGVNILELLQRQAKQHGLEEFHNEVILKAGTDLNHHTNNLFHITFVSILNFRSIDDLTLDNLTGVSVLRGGIGSGKSSIVEAINYALLGNRKGQRSLLKKGKKTMEVTIHIQYENLNYEITRGWNEGGFLHLKIEGEEIESENIRTIESKLKESLPFLSFLSYFNRSQESGRFLGELSYPGRINLISKIIGLDILDRLRSVSEKLLTDLELLIETEREKQLKLEGQVEELSTVDLSDLDKDYHTEISSKKEELETLRDVKEKNNRLKNLKERIEDISGLLGTEAPELEDIEEITRKETETISFLNYYSRERTRFLHKAGETSKALGRAEEKIKLLTEEKKKCKRRLEDLNDIERCSYCGQSIDSKTRQTIDQSITSSIDVIDSCIRTENDSVSSFRNNNKQELERIETLEKEIEFLNLQLEKLKERKDKRERDRKSNERVKAAKEKRDSLQREIRIIEGYLEVNVDEDYLYSKIQELEEEIKDLERKLEKHNTLRRVKEKLKEGKTAILNTKLRIEEHKKEESRIRQYLELVHLKGPVSWSILSKVSKLMSTDDFEVVAYKQKVSGDVTPDFSVKMKINGLLIDYDDLSGGQKIICDTFLIKSFIDILGGIGFMTFDETFGELDSFHLDEIMGLVEQINSSSIFIVSHEVNFPQCDRVITAELNGNTSLFSVQ